MIAAELQLGERVSPRPSRHWRTLVSAAPLLPIVIYLGALFAVPVLRLLSNSFLDATGAFTLVDYQRLFASSTYVRVLGTTFWFSAWTTVLSLVMGYPVAYLLAAADPARRDRLLLWVLLPFWTSFLVRTFSWIVLLGRHGAINDWLQALHLTHEPLELIYNSTGVFIGLVHSMLPLAILTMMSVMQGIDPRLVRAAHTLGAGRGQAFWRVYFPLSMPGVAAAGILVFVSTLGFFITPALLGSGREITISQVIIDQIDSLNWGFGGAVGVLLLTAALLAFFVYDRVFGLSSLAGSSVVTEPTRGPTARMFERGLNAWIGLMGWLSDYVERSLEIVSSPDPSKPRRRLGSALLWAVGIAILIFLAAPSLFVIPISFTKGAFLEWPPTGFSLKWYAEFFTSELWLSAIARSLFVATISAALATAIGVPAAFCVMRTALPGRSVIVAFILSPLIVPRIIIAVALFYLYAHVGLVGTSAGLILGHTVLSLPYVAITVMAILKSYDRRFDQAARSLGASHTKMLRFVTLPLIWPGLVAAYLFAFVTSLDELTVALFVTGGLTTTLPKQMWDGAILNVGPIVAAASTVTLILVTTIIVVAQRLQRRGSTVG